MLVDRVLLFSLVLLTQGATNDVIAGVAIDDPILAPVWNLEGWGRDEGSNQFLESSPLFNAPPPHNRFIDEADQGTR